MANHPTSCPTIELVRCLTSPLCMLDGAKMKSCSGMGVRSIEQAAARSEFEDSIGHQENPPYIVDREELLSDISSMGFGVDLDFAELVVLGYANHTLATRTSRGVSDHTQRLLDRVSSRVVDLIIQRPEFLDPFVHVSNEHLPVHQSVLKFLFECRVALNPDRLCAQVPASPTLQAMLAKTIGDGHAFDAFIAQEALESGTNVASTVTTLLRIGHKLPRDGSYFPGLIRLCAGAAASSDRHFQDALTLLDEIQWKIQQGEDSPVRPMRAPEDGKGIEPMLTLFAMASKERLSISTGNGLASKSVTGFPGQRIDAMSERLAGIVDARDWKPLGAYSHQAVLEAAFVPQSIGLDDNPAIAGFWRGYSPLDRRPNTLADILDWAVVRRDQEGRAMTVSDVLDPSGKLAAVLGIGRLNEIRAQLAQREMASAIARCEEAASAEVGTPTRPTIEAAKRRQRRAAAV